MTVTRSRYRRFGLAVCFGLPTAVIAGSYLWLAVERGTPFLWNVVVHESGRYTLGGTVFYFGHFLREVPTVVAYSLFLMGVSGQVDAGGSFASPRAVGLTALIFALTLVTGALLVAATRDGWHSAFLDLLQFRTRDDLSEYGSHWRFHWLSTLWFGAGTATVALLARGPGIPTLRVSRRWMGAAWGFFVAMSLVFGVSADVFSDGRYVGHQAREILTHGPMTALLGLGVVLALTPPGPQPGDSSATPVPDSKLAVWSSMSAFLLIPAYLGVAGLAGDAMGEAQGGQGLAALVGAHYFEHMLDYVLMLLLLVAGLGLKHPGARANATDGS